MTDDPGDILLEEAVSAYRERSASGRILPSPAWWDLSADSREQLFRRQLQSRILESALDRGGLSTTVKSVLSRLKSGRRF